jgi:carotenoid cleavage dioxygenase
VSYFFGRGNTVQYSVIGSDGRCRRTVDIEVTGSPMMHDFSLTQHHVVFYDLPVTFDTRQVAQATVPPLLRKPAQLVLSAIIGRVRVPDPIAAMAASRFGANAGFPYRWDRRYPARIGVMPREGGNADVRWFDVESCYVFHPMNAYNDGETIVLDIVRHPKMFDTDLHGPNDGAPTLDRWTVDLNAGKVREQRLDDRAQEFPRIDERLVGRPHRYGYTPEVGRGLDQGSALLKHDLQQGQTTTREFGQGKQIGEFVFEPSAPDAAEDNGVLMGLVYDKAESRSDLMILDAASLETVATVHLPVRIPNGFHGNWVPTTG